MENDQNSGFHQQNNQPISIQQSLPNATAVLVLGILSIVTCFCWGIIGIIMAIIALVLYNKDMALYNGNPAIYTLSSLSNLKAGRITAIIGLILSIIWFLVMIIYVVFIGAVLLNPWDLYDV